MAIRHNLELSVTEPNNEVGNLKIRQGDEQTQTLVVQITENGIAKPFTGLQPFFCAKLGQTAGLGIVEQKVIGTMNPANGTLEYVMQPEDWQQIGRQTGYFSFRKMKNAHEWTEQFSTRDFAYNVIPSAIGEIREVKKDGSTYVWTIEDMLRLFKEYIATGKVEWENYKNDERTIWETYRLAEKTTWEKFVEDNREFLETADPGGKIILELLGARGGAQTLGERLDSEKAEVTAQLADTALGIPEQNNIRYYTKLMKDLLTVIIECWGDSTYYGHASGVDPLGTQVAEPVPVTLQKALRSYFDNTNITVINKGVNGKRTEDVIGTWEANMIASTANIVYINYGINDAKDTTVNANKYRDNLRFMVKSARKTGKVVILDTPNVVTHVDFTGDGMGNASRAENIKQYVEIMREVSKELNVPIVDNYTLTSQYLEDFNYLPTLIPDGMHPSEAMYKFKAFQMASIFVLADTSKIKLNSVISGASPLVRAYGSPNSVSSIPVSKVGLGKFAQKIKVAFFVDEPNLDIYIATSVWSKGSSDCDVVVDNNIVKKINMFFNDFGSPNPYPVDLEMKVIEKASRGLHIVELINNDTGIEKHVGLFYLRSRKSTAYNKTAYSTGGTTLKQPVTIAENLEVVNVNGESHTVTDYVTSRLMKDLDIEVTAKLGKDQGFSLFTNQRNNGQPRGGITLFIDNTTGYLKITEGYALGYTNTAILNSVDLSTTVHVYRVEVSTAGVATVFIDGTQVGTFTMTTKLLGGFFGVWTGTAGTVKLDKITFYE